MSIDFPVISTITVSNDRDCVRIYQHSARDLKWFSAITYLLKFSSENAINRPESTFAILYEIVLWASVSLNDQESNIRHTYPSDNVQLLSTNHQYRIFNRYKRRWDQKRRDAENLAQSSSSLVFSPLLLVYNKSHQFTLPPYYPNNN